MQLRFITIPQGYSHSTPAPTPAEPWWKASYHWLLSLIRLETPAESSRIVSADNQTKSPSGIIVSESFGSCSDIYAATRNFGFYDGASPLLVVTKGFVGPGFGSEAHTREYKEAMRDRVFSYTPGTTKTQK